MSGLGWVSLAVLRRNVSPLSNSTAFTDASTHCSKHFFFLQNSLSWIKQLVNIKYNLVVFYSYKLLLSVQNQQTMELISASDTEYAL